jgi:protein-L-isoaspartate O-methyltransferase
MILPVGAHREDQMYVLMDKLQDGRVVTRELFPVRYVPLVPGKQKLERVGGGSGGVAPPAGPDL